MCNLSKFKKKAPLFFAYNHKSIIKGSVCKRAFKHLYLGFAKH